MKIVKGAVPAGIGFSPAYLSRNSGIFGSLWMPLQITSQPSTRTNRSGSVCSLGCLLAGAGHEPRVGATLCDASFSCDLTVWRARSCPGVAQASVIGKSAISGNNTKYETKDRSKDFL